MHHGLLLPNLSYKDLKQKITNLFTTTRHKFWASGDFLRISWFPMESSWIVISYSSPINMRVSTFSTVVRRSRDTAANPLQCCMLSADPLHASISNGGALSGWCTWPGFDYACLLDLLSSKCYDTRDHIKVLYKRGNLWPSHGESSHVLSCIITFEIWKERFCIIMSDHFTCH